MNLKKINKITQFKIIVITWKYLPTLGELIDRLTIVQLKEVKIPQHKEEYAKEIAEIVHAYKETFAKTLLKGIKFT